ncbi:hypothetical protein KEM56_003258, partial [Ascosphaera pollenicola]
SDSDPDTCISRTQADTVFRLGQLEYSYLYRDEPRSLRAATAHYGVWIAELAGHIRAQIAGRDGEMVYRHNIAHDGSLAPLLGVMQVEEMVWPGMGSEIVFEVFRKREKGTGKGHPRCFWWWCRQEGRRGEGEEEEEGTFFVRVLWGGKVMKSSNPDLGELDMISAERRLAYFDGLVGENASKVPGLCQLSPHLSSYPAFTTSESNIAALKAIDSSHTHTPLPPNKPADLDPTALDLAIRRLVLELKPFGLTKAEVLMILNLGAGLKSDSVNEDGEQDEQQNVDEEMEDGGDGDEDYGALALLDTVIEDREERLSDEDIIEILKIIRGALGPVKNEGENASSSQSRLEEPFNSSVIGAWALNPQTYQPPQQFDDSRPQSEREFGGMRYMPLRHEPCGASLQRHRQSIGRKSSLTTDKGGKLALDSIHLRRKRTTSLASSR